jgi:hypothetical protein
MTGIGDLRLFVFHGLPVDIEAGMGRTASSYPGRTKIGQFGLQALDIEAHRGPA